MASTADIIGVYIAVDITAATDTAITAITVPMGIMAIAIARMATTAMPIVPMGITAIGDTVTMGAIGDTATTVAIGDTDTTVAIGDMATMVAIGDTDIMVAIGPIAGTGGAVHIVAGVDRRPFKRATLSR